MLVRSRDDIYRMSDLKGKKIGLSRSQNKIKTDWWGIQEEQGIELMLRLNGMTRKDVQIVEFPYPDDWYDKPEMMGPLMENPSELWLRRDHKHDLAFRPLETALEKGTIDAMYMQTGPLAAALGGHRQVQGDRGPLPPSGLDPAGGQYPRRHHLQRRHGREASRTRGHLHEGHDQSGPLGQRAQTRRGGDPRQADVLSRRGSHVRGIKDIDMVPNLSPQNLVSVEIGKDFMLSHGYIKNDFDVQKWAAPEFLEQAAKELLEEAWKKKTTAKLPEGTQLHARVVGRSLTRVPVQIAVSQPPKSSAEVKGCKRGSSPSWQRSEPPRPMRPEQNQETNYESHHRWRSGGWSIVCSAPAQVWMKKPKSSWWNAGRTFRTRTAGFRTTSAA